MAEDQLISLQEAAVLAGLSDSHLRRLAEKGRLKARKIGRNWVTTAVAVEQYLKDDRLRSKDPHKYQAD